MGGYFTIGIAEGEEWRDSHKDQREAGIEQGVVQAQGNHAFPTLKDELDFVVGFMRGVKDSDTATQTP